MTALFCRFLPLHSKSRFLVDSIWDHSLQRTRVFFCLTHSSGSGEDLRTKSVNHTKKKGNGAQCKSISVFLERKSYQNVNKRLGKESLVDQVEPLEAEHDSLHHFSDRLRKKKMVTSVPHTRAFPFI